MDETEKGGWSGLLTVLIGGGALTGLIKLVGSWKQRKAKARAIEADAEKTCAEADAINIEAAADVVSMMQTELKRLGEDVKALRIENAELRQRVDDCEEDRRNLHRDMREMREKLARLEAK